MDGLFTADVRLKYEDLLLFNLYHELKKGNKFRTSILLIFGLGVLLLGTILVSLLNKFSVYYLAYIVILLLLPVGRYGVIVSRTKSSIREYEQAGGRSRYEFTQDSVLREKTDGTGTKNAEFKYDSYVRIVKTQEAFYLYITEDEVNIIPRGSLTKGTPEELEKFLAGKLGENFVLIEGRKR